MSTFRGKLTNGFIADMEFDIDVASTKYSGSNINAPVLMVINLFPFKNSTGEEKIRVQLSDGSTQTCFGLLSNMELYHETGLAVGSVIRVSHFLLQNTCGKRYTNIEGIDLDVAALIKELIWM